MTYHRWIPDTDILGRKLTIGDKVDIFNTHFIAYENCAYVKQVHGDEDITLPAVKVNENMFLFGLGRHEIIKCEN